MVLAVSVFFLSTCPAAGAVIFDDGDATDSDWERAANWGGDVLPAGTDDANIGNGLTADVTGLSTGAVANQTFVGDATGVGVLNVSGGTLDIDALLIGSGGNKGTVSLTGGTVTISESGNETQAVQIGHQAAGAETSVLTIDGATVVTTGGRFEVGTANNANATFYMKSGSVTMDNQSLILGQGNENDVVTIEFSGGTFSNTGGADYNINDGDATHNHTGGTLTIGDDLQGNKGGTDGDFFNLDVSAGAINIGDIYNGRNGNDTFTVRGTGTLTFGGNFNMTNTGAREFVLNVNSGGTINIGGDLNDRNGTSTINLNGGTVTTGGSAGLDALFEADNLNVGATANHAQTGAGAIGATASTNNLQFAADAAVTQAELEIDGGTLSVANNMTVGDGTGSKLTLTSGGLTLNNQNGTFDEIGAYNQDGGTLTLAVSSPNTASITATDVAITTGTLTVDDRFPTETGSDAGLTTTWSAGSGEWSTSAQADWTDGRPDGQVWFIGDTVTVITGTSTLTDGGLALDVASDVDWDLNSDVGDNNLVQIARATAGAAANTRRINAVIDGGNAVTFTGATLDIAQNGAAGIDAAALTIDGAGTSLEVGTVGTPQDLRLANDNAVGDVDVTDNASLTVRGDLIIGGETIDNNSTLNIGGTVVVDGVLNFGAAASDDGGIVNLNSGSLTINNGAAATYGIEELTGVDNAQLHINGGTLTVTGDILVQRFSLGEATSSSGATHTIGAGRSVKSTGTTSVGSSGTTALLTVNGSLEANGDSFVAEKANSSGTMTVNPGATVLFTSKLEVGDAAGSNGTLNIDCNSFTVNGDTRIGDTGQGTVTITGDGTYGFARVYLGDDNNATAIGELTIELDNPADAVTTTKLVVGNNGKGTLNLIEGTLTSTTDLRMADAGNATTANGRTATVVIGRPAQDTNPTLNIQNNLENGDNGDGILTMWSGTINMTGNNNWIIGQTSTGTAVFNMYGGLVDFVSDPDIGTNGILKANSGDGVVNMDGGTLKFRDIQGANNAAGSTEYNFDGGMVIINDHMDFRNNGTDTVNLDGATLDLTGGDIHYGDRSGTNQFNFTDGTLKNVGTFYGDLTQAGGTMQDVTNINGNMTLQGGTMQNVANVYGNLDQQDGTVKIGNSPGTMLVDGLTYDLGAAGILEIEIAGTNGAGDPDGHDKLSMTGGSTATINGTIDVNLIDGFSLSDGDSFQIVLADTIATDYVGNVKDLFDITDAGPGAGLEWKFDKFLGTGAERGTIYVVPEPGTLGLLVLGGVAVVCRRRRA